MSYRILIADDHPLVRAGLVAAVAHALAPERLLEAEDFLEDATHRVRVIDAASTLPAT